MGKSNDSIAWDSKGLVPAVVQDAQTGEVLTVAYMNAKSLKRTLKTGQTWFWSRSRKELWNKGETSGNTQKVRGLGLDCDKDAILVQVEPAGPACHTGETSCFFEPVEGAPRTSPPDPLGAAWAELRATLADRNIRRPEGSYTTRLLRRGPPKIAQKVGEEASEVIVAALAEDADSFAGEVADLLYHVSLLMEALGLPAEAVAAKLVERRR